MSALQSYALPFIGAVLLHSLVAAFVMRGFDSQEGITEVITPRMVNAKLLVIEPPPQFSPAPSKQPAVKRAEPPAPEPQPALKDVKPDPLESADAAAKAVLDTQSVKLTSKRTGKSHLFTQNLILDKKATQADMYNAACEATVRRSLRRVSRHPLAFFPVCAEVKLVVRVVMRISHHNAQKLLLHFEADGAVITLGCCFMRTLPTKPHSADTT